jgi:hypothetical protein
MPRTVIPLLALVLALAAVTAASAHNRVFRSQVTIRQNPEFHGKVLSTNHRCEVDRKVKLVLRKPGTNRVVGVTFTDENGKWAITDPDQGGIHPNKAYRAAVARKVLRNDAGHRHVCRADRSKTVRLSKS